MQIKTLAALAIVPALFTAPQIVPTGDAIAAFSWVNSAQAAPLTLKEGVRLNPRTKKQLRKRPGRTNIVPVKPRLLCPDPAVVDVYVRNYVRNPDGSYRFSIWPKIKNVGRAYYRSSWRQQSVVIMHGSHVLKTSHWTRILPPGRTVVSEHPYFFRNWKPNPGEFAKNITVQIIYAPDIRIDGNPENDDCRRSNNRKVFTVREINRKIRVPGF